ncbi:hypothetical protein RB653_002162 [Dictyostelium firmibasis]|uniref:Uncharacterized protein n=1 Tax=Dictyostelium firmibasis TaxID=79012 RepID=A0AAN7YVF0_9MYCE
MNQSFKRLFNNKFFRNYSSYSISKEQILTANNQKKKSNRIGKFIAFTVISKLGYDVTNTALAYYKGQNATTETIVSDSWNDILYPVFQVVTNDPTVIKTLGGAISFESPPSDSKSPIIELKRDFNFKLAPIDLKPPTFHDNQWFLQKTGVGSDKKPIDLDKLTEKEKKHLELGIMDTIYQELKQYSLSEQISMIPNQYLPLLVPYKNRIFPLIYGETTSDVIIPIKGPKGNASILFNLYASDDKWQVRNAEVIFDSNNKKKQFIKSTSDEL